MNGDLQNDQLNEHRKTFSGSLFEHNYKIYKRSGSVEAQDINHTGPSVPCGAIFIMRITSPVSIRTLITSCPVNF